MLSTVLLTGVALLAAGVAAIALYGCVRTFEKTEALAEGLSRDLRALAVLRIDVDSLDTRLRRLSGTVYSPPGRARKSPGQLPAANGALELDDLSELDPELAAELSLQRAPAASPGKP